LRAQNATLRIPAGLQFCSPRISNRVDGIFVPPGKLEIVDSVE